MAFEYVHMERSSVKKLATAIVMQSVTDYMDALIHDDQDEAGKCRIFFGTQSDWFDWLSGGTLDGKTLMVEIEKKAKNFIRECLQHTPEYGNEEAAAKASFKCPCCGRTVVIKFTGQPLGKGRIFTRFHSYICSSCGMQCKIRYDEDCETPEERIKYVITTPECRMCEHFDSANKRCRELGKRREYDDVCFGWENRESWRNWLMQEKS